MDIIKILFVEDDIVFRSIIKDCLELTGEFKVTEAKDGLEGFGLYQSDKFDIIIVDIDMPKMSGLALVELIRKKDTIIPILVASGLTANEQIRESYQYEIDAFIKKPYGSEELIGSIKSVLKRLKDFNQIITKENSLLPMGLYIFDCENCCLKIREHIIPLSKRETQILYLLYKNKGKLVQRSVILNKFWGEDDFFKSRSLDVFITKLRKHLIHDPSIEIFTVRGEGLKLNY